MHSIIAAFSQNYVMGKAGKMPWHLPTDLKRFKAITWGKPIVMGRKTFESIGKPLPNRQNVVVTRNSHFKATGVVVYNSIDDALNAYAHHPETVIIGGGQLYEQMMNRCHKLYISVIQQKMSGDTYFPPLDYSKWAVLEKALILSDHLPYTTLTLVRKNP